MNSEIDFLRSEIKRLRNALNKLTPPLQEMIKRRGFKIYKKEPLDDLFLPEEKYIDIYYEMLKKYSFRLFIRDVIKCSKESSSFTIQDVTRYATREVTSDYVSFLQKIELIIKENNSFKFIKQPIRSFGETLEWFVAEILKREFSMETIRGVKLKKRLVGGDYDILSKFNGSILYMEIKSSPPKQIYSNEIGAFLDRVSDFLPDLAIFFVDTELRMKDKIVPMFEDELKAKLYLSISAIRIEREIFQISGDLKELPKIFIINSKDSIINNIQVVLTSFFRAKVI